MLDMPRTHVDIEILIPYVPQVKIYTSPQLGGNRTLSHSRSLLFPAQHLWLLTRQRLRLGLAGSQLPRSYKATGVTEQDCGQEAQEDL